MARQPRLVAPNYPLHVTQRGHNREVTFRDEHDFARYRDIVLRASLHTSCAVHAYAFMSNHVHLLVTPNSRFGAARFMQRVGSQFVAYWNKRHRRTGTLWNGRFKSSIVDNDLYFLACCRYIDLNPVRAGLVREPALYEWSSHKFLAYGLQDAVITPHTTYEALGSTQQMRQLAYRDYCAQGTPSRGARVIRAATQRGAATGDTQFLTRVECLLHRPATRYAHGGDRKSDAWQDLIP